MPNKKFKEEAGIVLSLVIDGLKISKNKGKSIINYVRTIMRDYANNPAGALKEIPLNLKSKERLFASFLLGNYYSTVFNEMNADQVEVFFTGIAEILKIKEKEIEILDYLTIEVMEKMVTAKLSLSDIISNMANSKFSDTEKDYIFFIYGLNFMYGKIH